MRIEDRDWDLISAKEINELMRQMRHMHHHDCPHHKKKKKHKKKEEIATLRKELDSIKEKCVELKRENLMLKNEVHRLTKESKMNQPRGKRHPGFWGAPFYCWGTDAWK